MNAYLTQSIRTKYGIDWQEEYILGLVAHTRLVRVIGVLELASEIMAQATAHKYLTQLITKEMLEHDIKGDKRVKGVKLTSKGVKILRELANVSAVPSLAVS